MGALDLRGIRRVIGEFIADEVLVTRDNDSADDTLDEANGQLVPTEAREIYAGPGAIQPIGNASATPDGIDVAVQPLDSNTTHRLLLTLETTARFRIGDDVEMIAANPLSGDSQMVGNEYEVTEVPDQTSFAVIRFVFLKPKTITARASAGDAGAP